MKYLPLFAMLLLGVAGCVPPPGYQPVAYVGKWRLGRNGRRHAMTRPGCRSTEVRC